jgi:acetylornithine deacetylase/succinyl-diaminopimelate desuccinylase-like protein
VISSDGGQYSDTQPELTVGLRGLAALQIDVRGPNADVHSGMFGGAIANPIHALVEILDSMRGADGKILVEGFYDRVRPLTGEDRGHIAAVPHDDEAFKARVAVNDTYGEPGYSTLERIWARPTLEVNGIWGGFQGIGTKTVLPSEAHAKITCRLVADQKPEEIADLLTKHILTHTPPGVTVNVQVGNNKADPYLMPADHPGNLAARDVHLELYEEEPLYVRSGGSIPFCSLFQKVLGVYTVNFAFALNDEKQHSPNEFFRLHNFERGQKAYCMLLERLGKE